MKNIVIILVFSLTFCSLNAQDIIATKDGRRIETKIKSVSEKLIMYETDEGTNTIKKELIDYIYYANGKVEDFGKVQSSDSKEITNYLSKQNECYFYNAKQFRNKGIYLMVGGAALEIVGTVLYVLTIQYPNYYPYGMGVAGTVLMAASAPIFVSGFICLMVGSAQMSKYRDWALIQTDRYRLDMAMYGNGVGLKLKF